MEDSDTLRRFIEVRLEQLRLDHASVSRLLGKNRTYLHDYLRKGTPKTMPLETKVALAGVLEVAPSQMGVTAAVAGLVQPGPGFADDAEPYTPDADFGTLPPHVAPFVMRSRALDLDPNGIAPGSILNMDLNATDPAMLASGDIVIAQLCDRHELTKSHGTVIRMFVRPDKLITNSTGDNEMFALDDRSRPYVAIIKGRLIKISQIPVHGGWGRHQAGQLPGSCFLDPFLDDLDDDAAAAREIGENPDHGEHRGPQRQRLDHLLLANGAGRKLRQPAARAALQLPDPSGERHDVVGPDEDGDDE